MMDAGVEGMGRIPGRPGAPDKSHPGHGLNTALGMPDRSLFGAKQVTTAVSIIIHRLL